MNIFATHLHPSEAANCLDDKRVVKMILETAQILSTAVYLNSNNSKPESDLYKPTHWNHPCVLWAAENQSNFFWLCKYGNSLGFLYTWIYEKEHASIPIIARCQNFYFYKLKKLPNTPFADCSGVGGNNPVILKYRQCLVKKWDTDKHKPKWTKRGPPVWYRKGDKQ